MASLRADAYNARPNARQGRAGGYPGRPNAPGGRPEAGNNERSNLPGSAAPNDAETPTAKQPPTNARASNAPSDRLTANAAPSEPRPAFIGQPIGGPFARAKANARGKMRGVTS